MKCIAMASRLLLLATTVVLTTSVGCKTNTPIVRHHQWSAQTKLQAVQHWKVFAARMAENVSSSGQFPSQTVHLETLGESTEFSYAFANLLVSELIDRGFKVVQADRKADAKLVVGHQVLVHGRRFGFSMNATAPLGGLAMGMRNMLTGDDSGTPGQTRGEVLSTLWILQNSKVLYCRNQVAYINSKDASLYMTEEEFGKFSKSEESGSKLSNWFSEVWTDDSRW